MALASAPVQGGRLVLLGFHLSPLGVGGKGGRTLREARGAVWTLQRVPRVWEAPAASALHCDVSREGAEVVFVQPSGTRRHLPPMPATGQAARGPFSRSGAACSRRAALWRPQRPGVAGARRSGPHPVLALGCWLLVAPSCLSVNCPQAEEAALAFCPRSGAGPRPLSGRRGDEKGRAPVSVWDTCE